MMNMKAQPASGRASALRVRLAASPTPIFKTRFEPCPLPVRAAFGNTADLNAIRLQLSDIRTSTSDNSLPVRPFGPVLMRFTEHRTLKTEHPQRRCELLFPRAAGRCRLTGLLEQMP